MARTTRPLGRVPGRLLLADRVAPDDAVWLLLRAETPVAIAPQRLKDDSDVDQYMCCVEKGVFLLCSSTISFIFEQFKLTKGLCIIYCRPM